MAASKQASIHTHMCNAVTLVWDSLRLAPIKLPQFISTLKLASFPGPAQFPSLTVRISGRGPGIFSHVSDVECREKGKEDLIERRRIVDVPTSVVA